MGGHVHNPYDLTRTPGGSSGGTGASIAANFAMVGIGSDTMNSVLCPLRRADIGEESGFCVWTRWISRNEGID